MPSDKRARQRAGRATRMAELQQAQKRRNRLRRGVPAAIVAVIIAVVGIILTTSSGGKKNVTTNTAVTTTTTPAATTTLPLGTGLVDHPAPPVSRACTTGSTSPGKTTTPASGHAVSIVTAPAHVPFPKLDGTSPRYTKFSAPPPFCIDVAKTYTATVQTDAGTIIVKLLPKYAPVTVNNFVFLAGYHFFDGITFHRVIPGFMDQVGDPTATGQGGPGYSFKDELPSSSSAYGPGAVAMANSGPNTNGSQFFIVVPGGGSGLSAAYSVFGQVTSGLSIVEKINSDGTSAGTPNKYHKILKVTITES